MNRDFTVVGQVLEGGEELTLAGNVPCLGTAFVIAKALLPTYAVVRVIRRGTNRLPEQQIHRLEREAPQTGQTPYGVKFATLGEFRLLVFPNQGTECQRFDDGQQGWRKVDASIFPVNVMKALSVSLA